MKRFALFVCLSMTLLAGCADSKAVQMIKNGKIESCPDATVNQMVNSSLASPSWKSGENYDGIIFVNVDGDITYAGKPVHALIQFVVYPKKGEFEFLALEFNQIPQMNPLAAGFIKKMCQSARNSKNIRIGLKQH